MITEITLENFKGYRERTCIPIAPITLFYGPNSAGKSSIFQALMYLYEIIVNDWCDVDLCSLAPVDLGGFCNLVNRDSGDKFIRLGVRFNISTLSSPASFESWDDPDELFELSEKHSIGTIPPDSEAGPENTRLEFEIRWSDLLQKPYVASLSIELDDDPILRVKSSEDLKELAIDKINFSHRLFDGYVDKDSEITGIRNILHSYFYLGENSNSSEEIRLPIRANDLGAKPPLGSALSLTSGEECLNQWAEEADAKLEEHHSSDIEVEDFHLQLNKRYEILHAVTLFFSEVVINRIRELAEILKGFAAIGPMRDVPQRGFVPARRLVPNRWYSGLGGWDAVANCSSDELDEISQWMFRLKMGYTLIRNDQWRNTCDPTNRGNSLPVVLQDINGNKFEPRDVGIGISQLLPVVAATALTKIGIVYVEQPELHIHPALQVELGDLLCAHISKLERYRTWDEELQVYHRERTNDKTFIFETHSEHLLLRVLRRVRQTNDGVLPDNDLALYPDDVSVIYIDSTKGVSQAQRLRIDEEGEFIDRWPDGFFDERDEELF